jgi:uncharacterized protein involved in exopolysaccharide biosynthesis
MSAPSQITGPPQAALDQPDELIRGVFEPPKGFVLSAISRNKLVIVAAVVVCALIGAGLGATRSRTYTATATLQVGQVNPNSPGFLGYVQSASALATAFSRAISAEPVLAAVQRELKLAPSTASARLSSEPIPLAPSFLVIAAGPTEPSAVRLANVAASAVVAYESQSNSANPEAASLLKEYHEASFQLQQAGTKLSHIGRDASANARAQAAAEKNTAAVRLHAIGNAYTAAIASQAPRNGLVSLLASATTATNNRKSKIEIFGFIGLLAGVVIGCVAAVLRERRRSNRWLAQQ